MSTPATLGGSPPRAGSAHDAEAPRRCADRRSRGAATAATVRDRRAHHRPSAHAAIVASRSARVSPVLLALLFIVSIAGAAFGGWYFAQSRRRRDAAGGDVPAHDVPPRRSARRALRARRRHDRLQRGVGRQAEPRSSSPTAQPRGAAAGRRLTRKCWRSRSRRSSRSCSAAIASPASARWRASRSPAARRARSPTASLHADWSPDGIDLAIIRVGERQVPHRVADRHACGTRRRTASATCASRRTASASRSSSRARRQERRSSIIDEAAQAGRRSRAAGRTARPDWPGRRTEKRSGSPAPTPPRRRRSTRSNVDTATTRLVIAAHRLDEALRHLAGRPRRCCRTARGARRSNTRRRARPPSATCRGSTGRSLADLSRRRNDDPLQRDARRRRRRRARSISARADAPTPVRIGDGFGDALSPDGKWVLCHIGPKLVVVPTGSGEPRELKIDGAFDSGAAWLPDSRRVDRRPARCRRRAISCIVDRHARRDRQTGLAREHLGRRVPAVRRVARRPHRRRHDRRSKPSRSTISKEPRSRSTCTAREPGEIPIQWSADGASLFVYRPTALPARVYRVTLATGARELWKEFTTDRSRRHLQDRADLRHARRRRLRVRRAPHAVGLVRGGRPRGESLKSRSREVEASTRLAAHTGQPAMRVRSGPAGDVEITSLDAFRDRTSLAVADANAIDASHRRHFRRRAGEEDLVGGVERLARQSPVRGRGSRDRARG